MFKDLKGCSQCCEGALLMKGAAADGETEMSEEESRAYYECDKCGFRVKEFADGRTDFPDNDEWAQFCSE